MIPEQESWCSLPGGLDGRPDIVAAWREWVAGGGGLVIHSSNEAKVKVADLFETVFGLRGIGGVAARILAPDGDLGPAARRLHGLPVRDPARGAG